MIKIGQCFDELLKKQKWHVFYSHTVYIMLQVFCLSQCHSKKIKHLQLAIPEHRSNGNLKATLQSSLCCKSTNKTKTTTLFI